jgi:8-oxo-dGTP diphosphatase
MAPADDPRDAARSLAAAVRPLDPKEADDQARILAWIDSGAQLFRTAPPATPPCHLVVYFALLDEASRALLLVDHRKAGLWLPTGGHVEDGEDPRDTVRREALEELGITPAFHDRAGAGTPLFLTVTATRGDHSHTDVTMWFVLRGDRDMSLAPDPGEFSDARWFSLDGQPGWPTGLYDPEMERFARKLTRALDG